MTQADRVHSTPPANTSATERRDRLANAYMRMEADVYNLERMGAIADRLIAELLDDLTNHRAAEHANFAVQHLADMLRLFKEGYGENFSITKAEPELGWSDEEAARGRYPSLMGVHR